MESGTPIGADFKMATIWSKNRLGCESELLITQHISHEEDSILHSEAEAISKGMAAA